MASKGTRGRPRGAPANLRGETLAIDPPLPTPRNISYAVDRMGIRSNDFMLSTEGLTGKANRFRQPTAQGRDWPVSLLQNKIDERGSVPGSVRLSDRSGVSHVDLES